MILLSHIALMIAAAAFVVFVLAATVLVIIMTLIKVDAKSTQEKEEIK